MIIQAPCSEYALDDRLDLQKVGRYIDGLLLEHFAGQKIVLRAISSTTHTMTQLQLAQHIEQLGTDRYGPNRTGDRYENAQGRHIDFFGRVCTVRRGGGMSLPLLEGFHIYGPEYHGEPAVRMDTWLVYDKAQLRTVPHSYAQTDKGKRDGFTFRDPEHKTEALLGVILV
jgi:hypothetical protein